LVALLLFLLLGASASAADFSVQSQVDAQKLGVDDQIQLTITVSGPGVDEIPLPALTNLHVVGGPVPSSQISFVNGAVSQSHSNTYVLQPQAPGKAEVGAVQVRAGNDTRTAPAIPIEVVAGSILQRQRQAAPDPFDPFGGEDPFETMLRGRRRGQPAPQPKIFLEAAVDRSRVHVGEPVLLTYYLYTQANVRDIQPAEAPQYPGLWTEDLERPKQAPGGERVTVNGETYGRFAIIQKLLFPTRAGALTIPQWTMRLFVQTGDGIFAPGVTSVDRATRPLTITALPIPETPGFSGAVGHFTVTATLDKDTVAIGDAATLRFQVIGEGNLKWVDKAPELALTGVKVYPPQVKTDLKTSPSGIAGTKTWEMILVPQTAGTITVPALPFTYFDPKSGQLATAETRPLELHAQGAAPSSAAGPSAAEAAVPTTASGAGPLALRSELDRPASRIPPVGARALAAAVALIVLAHVGFFVAAWLGRRPRTAEGRAAPGRDVRRALSELARAEHDGLSKEAAMALIERTLHEVFGPLEEATGPETERERAARRVLQDVHFIRYAPQLGDYSEKIREVARRAEEVVRRYA
jgi:hypothetical protein